MLLDHCMLTGIEWLGWHFYNDHANVFEETPQEAVD